MTLKDTSIEPFSFREFVFVAGAFGFTALGIGLHAFGVVTLWPALAIGGIPSGILRAWSDRGSLREQIIAMPVGAIIFGLIVLIATQVPSIWPQVFAGILAIISLVFLVSLLCRRWTLNGT